LITGVDMRVACSKRVLIMPAYGPRAQTIKRTGCW
jgi:hypothetical protein